MKQLLCYHRQLIRAGDGLRDLGQLLYYQLQKFWVWVAWVADIPAPTASQESRPGRLGELRQLLCCYLQESVLGELEAGAAIIPSLAGSQGWGKLGELVWLLLPRLQGLRAGSWAAVISPAIWSKEREGGDFRNYGPTEVNTGNSFLSKF